MFSELNLDQSRRATDLHLSESKLKRRSMEIKVWDFFFSVRQRGFNFKRERIKVIWVIIPCLLKTGTFTLWNSEQTDQQQQKRKKSSRHLLFGRKGPMRKPETPVCAAYLCSFFPQKAKEKKTENNIEMIFLFNFFFRRKNSRQISLLELAKVKTIFSAVFIGLEGTGGCPQSDGLCRFFENVEKVPVLWSVWVLGLSDLA